MKNLYEKLSDIDLDASKVLNESIDEMTEEEILSEFGDTKDYSAAIEKLFDRWIKDNFSLGMRMWQLASETEVDVRDTGDSIESRAKEYTLTHNSRYVDVQEYCDEIGAYIASKLPSLEFTGSNYDEGSENMTLTFKQQIGAPDFGAELEADSLNESNSDMQMEIYELLSNGQDEGQSKEDNVKNTIEALADDYEITDDVRSYVEMKADEMYEEPDESEEITEGKEIDSDKAIDSLRNSVETYEEEGSIDQDTLLMDIESAMGYIGAEEYNSVLDKLQNIINIVEEEGSVDQEMAYNTIKEVIDDLGGYKEPDETEVAGFDKGKELEKLHEGYVDPTPEMKIKDYYAAMNPDDYQLDKINDITTFGELKAYYDENGKLTLSMIGDIDSAPRNAIINAMCDLYDMPTNDIDIDDDSIYEGEDVDKVLNMSVKELRDYDKGHTYQDSDLASYVRNRLLYSETGLARHEKAYKDALAKLKNKENLNEVNIPDNLLEDAEAILDDETEAEVNSLINACKELQDTIKHTVEDEIISLNARIAELNKKLRYGVDEIALDDMYVGIPDTISDLEYVIKESNWAKEDEAANESEDLAEEEVVEDSAVETPAPIGQEKKDPRVGETYKNQQGAIIQITEPTNDGKPQFYIAPSQAAFDNRNQGFECRGTDSYESLDRILRHNLYTRIDNEEN